MMSPTAQRRAVPTLLALSALSACAVGPDYQDPPVAAAADRAWLSDADTGEVEQTWWRAFDDPLLEELVASAVRGNKDLDVASARLREVRAYRDAVRGRSGPQVGVTAGATENRLSAHGQLPVASIPGFDPQFPIYDAAFDASWELDFWGAQRRAFEAADARVGAAAEARRGVVLQAIAETVRAYFELRTAQALRASTLRDVRAQQALVDVVSERLRTGAASRLDLARTQAQARATAAALPGFDSDADAAAFRLALLVGRPPEALYARLRAPKDLPATPLDVGVGLRSDLLLRRPDIRQAERDLAAATADIGVAKAELFPRVTLLGTVGQQARAPRDLISNDSLRFQVGPALRWPVFSAGRIRAQIRAADARAETAAARYERAVLVALADSEAAINRYAAAGRTRAEREAARDEAAEAVILARRRYLAGEDDLTVILEAQSAFRAAERQSIGARGSELQRLAALYKALGGGWTAVDAVPLE